MRLFERNRTSVRAEFIFHKKGPEAFFKKDGSKVHETERLAWGTPLL